MRPSSRRRSTRMWRLGPPPTAPASPGVAPGSGAGPPASAPPTVTCATSPAALSAASICSAAAVASSRKLNRPSNSSASNAVTGGVTAWTAPSACARFSTSTARPPFSGASGRSVTCTRRPAASGSGSVGAGDGTGRSPGRRSEEHTSELQSPYDLVCRLLLEKKKIDLHPLFRLHHVSAEEAVASVGQHVLAEAVLRILPFVLRALLLLYHLDVCGAVVFGNRF